jgi:hypothetical protein
MNPITARLCTAGTVAACTAGFAAPAQATPTMFSTSFDFPSLARPMFGLTGARRLTARFHSVPVAAPAADPVVTRVRSMVAAGDRIARLPYLWGGGHGSFAAAGYDCSGSVSYVLHAAGLLSAPLDSTGFESYGLPGPGLHVTIYANAEHAWMTIDGRRFDTIAFQETGTRWSSIVTSGAAYVERHPAGM